LQRHMFISSAPIIDDELSGQGTMSLPSDSILRCGVLASA
jgi:hypothetical protein